MRTITRCIIIMGVLATMSAHAQAPKWSDEQSAIWAFVEQSWAAQVAEDGKWPGDFTHNDFVQWGDNEAAPRDRAAYIAWQRESDETGDMTSHEITPLTITIVGDTAIVAYSAALRFVNNDGETGSAVRNIFEVLTRDGGRWEYLASTDFTPNHEN